MDAVWPARPVVAAQSITSTAQLSVQSVNFLAPASPGGSEDAVKTDLSGDSLEALARMIESSLAPLAGNNSQSLPAMLGDAQAFDINLLDMLGPDMRKDYLAFASLLQNDDQRLQNFDKAISDLLAAVYGGQGPSSSEAGRSQGTPVRQDGAMLIGSYASFSAEAHLTAAYAASADGTVSVSRLDIDISITSVRIDTRENQPQQQRTDPLALDLNGDGKISLSGPKDGVLFDITGQGRPQQTSFVSGADGFLALDRNGNGVIDSGKELFGDQNGQANGFLELQTFDQNGDGAIDNQDSVFNQLRIVTRNNDGSLTLHRLSEYDIQRFSLGYRPMQQQLQAGNVLSALGGYTRSDGSQGVVADVTLSVAA
jgi:hypothetical protein